MSFRATVLIPAHNEAAVIARTLAPLAGVSALKIVVIANACTDVTAAVAQAACPTALVLETPVAGKTHALNLGYAETAGLPVICLDADLEVTVDALMALLAAVEAGAGAAVGQMQVDATMASPMVQAFQRAWALNPYFAKGKFGGLFALSAPVARQLFPLPTLTGDDEYIRRSLPAAEVAFVPACVFTAQSPRDLASLVAIRRRALRGARQVAALGLPNPIRSSARAMLVASLPAPRRLMDLAVFVGVSAAARLSLAMERPKAEVWERDLTTRQEGATS